MLCKSSNGNDQTLQSALLEGMRKTLKTQEEILVASSPLKLNCTSKQFIGISDRLKSIAAKWSLKTQKRGRSIHLIGMN